MKKAKVFVDSQLAGELQEIERNRHYRFVYLNSYAGPSVSLEMPINRSIYEFDKFPPFFDGVLPEGLRLEALLRQAKLDRTDYFGQLITVGADLVGAITVKEIK